ncbi:UDP-3-O-(3-hydroxymyristoyl)glucosamine N-acyltransferase [bacterium]|nr:UDP-3-O-(3-hydroxymyristoyl)glucosamine N-acyltransferase [bacterium]
MNLSVRHIAEQVHCEWVGEGDRIITGIAPLETAGPNQITFLTNPRLAKFLDQSQAGCIIVSKKVAQGRAGTFLVSGNPYYTFALVSQLFHPLARPRPGISDQAVIEENVSIAEACCIYPFVYISSGTHIGPGVTIFPHVFIGRDVTIGQDTYIYANVTIRENVRIGQRVIIHSGTVVGSDGYGFATEAGAHYKIPQIGNVIIEDEVELGAGVTIDRGTLGSTVIGRGTKFDNQVHIAHNVTIGEHSLLVAQVGIAGSTHIGKHVTIAGKSGVSGHLTVGDNASIAAATAVIKSVKPGAIVSGILPAREIHKAHRSIAALFRLPHFITKLTRLEKILRAKGILELDDRLGSDTDDLSSESE